MNNDNGELISALADDALAGRERERALEALHDNEALKARWERYHLIGDAMRREAGPGGAELAARIRAELEREPHLLAPRWRLAAPQLPGPRVAMALAASGLLAAVLLAVTSPFDETSPTAQRIARAPVAAPEPVPRWDRLDDERLAPYLVNHHLHSNGLGAQGMLPSVRIVSHSAGGR